MGPKCISESQQSSQLPSDADGRPNDAPAYRDSTGACLITLQVICREMPSDFTGMFSHCFIGVRLDGELVQAISGIRDDDEDSETYGTTISAEDADVPDWDVNEINIDERPHVIVQSFHPTFRRNIPDACCWLECARRYSRDLSGYTAIQSIRTIAILYNTSHSALCGTIYFPWHAVGSSNIYPTMPRNPPIFSGGNCFVADTEVLTPTGLVAIQDIEVGDLVSCWSFKNQKVIQKPVLYLVGGKATTLYRVHLTDEVLTVTGNHRFYVIADGWTTASNLVANCELLSSDATSIFVKKMEKVQQQASVYNFEVAEHHNYFVGSSSVLVHNVKM